VKYLRYFSASGVDYLMLKRLHLPSVADGASVCRVARFFLSVHSERCDTRIFLMLLRTCLHFIDIERCFLWRQYIFMYKSMQKFNIIVWLQDFRSTFKRADSRRWV